MKWSVLQVVVDLAREVGNCSSIGGFDRHTFGTRAFKYSIFQSYDLVTERGGKWARRREKKNHPSKIF